MLAEQFEQMYMKEVHNREKSLQEQINYLRDLEEKGIIAPAEPQTFYKYPTTIVLNHSVV